MKTHNYILDENGDPQVEPDLMKWATWFETSGNKRILGNSDVGEYRVSTVFLATDYNFWGGTPVLYETMVFEKKESEGEIKGRKYKYHKSLDEDGCFMRYHTKDEALAGHEEIVMRVRSMKKP